MGRALQRPSVARRAVPVLALASLVGCTTPAPREATDGAQGGPSATPPRPRAPTIVDYGPCVSTRDESPQGPRPRCIFDPGRRFRVWVDHEPLERLEVLVDGKPVPTTALEPLDDRSRGFGLRLDEAATRLEVGLEVGLAEEPERWVLPLAAQGHAEHEHGGDEARAAAASFYERLSSDPAVRTDWRQELPRVLGRLRAQGLLEEQFGAVDATVFVLSREHRFDQAAAALALAEPLGQRSPRLHAMLAYARGQLDWRSGRYGDALTSLRAASLHAVRADELDLGLVVLPMYAELLTELGYFQAASRWADVGLEQVRARGDACDVASTLRTTAWAHLRLRQHAWSNRDPVPMLAEALAIFGPDGECPRPDRTGGVRSSLALLELRAGAPADALATLRGIARSRMTPGERVLASDVELQARLTLGQGRSPIDRALEQLRRAVEDAGTTDARWHLALREGQVLEARGELEAAIEAYRRAEAYLDGLAQLAAFGVGRSTVGTSHRESSERLVDALRARGRTDEALCTARQAEARRLQTGTLPASLPEPERVRLEQRVAALHAAQAALEGLLQQERDAPLQALAQARARVAGHRRWLEAETDAILRDVGRHAQPPTCEALHRPEAGELLLGLFPRGDGWLLFAQDELETRVHAVELRELDLAAARARLGQILLRPVADQLRRARRIRVHAVGQAQRIEVGLLPWEGEPLVARVPVAWGVDVVATRGPASTAAAREPRAVLLADPTGSLPEAAAEVEEAIGRLERMGIRVEEIAREDARPHLVQERMAGALLLHYAGHAEHDELLDPGWWPPYPGGTPSWPASLRLADGTRLAAHEIAIRRASVPSKVILSGCRTGAIDAAAGGTSLAVAFLMAGAEEVLATSAVTGDAEARAVIHGVYEELGRAGPERWSLVDALARAEAQRIAAGEAGGPYRVWVR